MLSCTASYTHKYRNALLSLLSKNFTAQPSFPFYATYTAPTHTQHRITYRPSAQNNLRVELNHFVTLVFCVSEKITDKLRTLCAHATPFHLMNSPHQLLAKLATFCTKISAFPHPHSYPTKTFISGLISRISTLDI
ncbi:hypothetical protein HNQ57_002579 [Zhongshania antarctica]|uniref:Uncharacterized protein n=1 Tax=Zhongshania antarctica TaxID=641702 RepID=A0A840R7E4_9GAMM|nr:hypothetical protein [Zhongshania antarctica]